MWMTTFNSPLGSIRALQPPEVPLASLLATTGTKRALEIARKVYFRENFLANTLALPLLRQVASERCATVLEYGVRGPWEYSTLERFGTRKVY